MIHENELIKIDDEVNKCIKCGSMVEKFDKPNTISFGTNKDILLLGEAPANNGWRKSGKAWHDVSGKLISSGKNLEKLFSYIGIDFIDLSFTEVVKCFPIKPNNVKKCAVNCRDYLYGQINLMRPKIVIVLGDKAFRSISGFEYKYFRDVVGKQYKISYNGFETILFPIYHPSPASPICITGNEPLMKIIEGFLESSI